MKPKAGARRITRASMVLSVIAAAWVAVATAGAGAAGSSCGEWTALPSIALPQGTALTATVTFSPTDVWRAGTGRPPDGTFTAAHWNGTDWDRVVSEPLPKAAYVSARGVATASGEGYVAGTYQGDTVGIPGTFATPHGFVAHFDGQQWQILTPPQVPYVADTIQAVSDGPLGTFAVGTGFEGAVAYRIDDGALEPVPGLEAAAASLPAPFVPRAIAIGADAVRVIGDWADTVDGRVGLHVAVFAWNGTEWRREAVPDEVSDELSYALVEAATQTAGTAVAVGRFSDRSGDFPQVRALALVHDGTAWRRDELPSGANADLADVSADRSGGAWAVGSQYVRQTESALALHFDGAGWTDESPPTRAGFPRWVSAGSVDGVGVFAGGGNTTAARVPKGGCR